MFIFGDQFFFWIDFEARLDRFGSDVFYKNVMKWFLSCKSAKLMFFLLFFFLFRYVEVYSVIYSAVCFKNE